MMLVIAAMLLCSCDAGYNRRSAGASGYSHEICVIQNNVPYTGGIDLRLDSIELLDTDKYGRNLFFYRMTLSSLGILLVIQNTDEQEMYYYEDECYLLRKNATSPEAFSDKDINQIKERNDWDQPLEYDRMCSLSCTVPADHENIDDQSSARASVTQEMKKHYPEKDWTSARVNLNGLETFHGIGQLVLITLSFGGENPEYYIGLYNPKEIPKVHAISPAGDVESFRENIINYKEKYCMSAELCPENPPSDEP